MNYRIILSLVIFLFFIYFIYWNWKNPSAYREGTSAAMQIKMGKYDPKNKNDMDNFTPMDGKIEAIIQSLNDIKSIVPVSFAAGKIKHERIETPIVTFSGELPYIFINITMPYPLAGNPGDTGTRGVKGPTGPKGDMGDKGKHGYNGSNSTPWIFTGKNI
jgi:hypothetical protein